MEWIEGANARTLDALCSLCAQKPRCLGNTLSENDILYLQDIILTQGFHHVCLPDAVMGRDLMIMFIQALNYYNSVACLSALQDLPLHQSVRNIYGDLLDSPINSVADIENFFAESFDADFMWIETTDELLKLPFVSWLWQTVHSVAASEHIPIVALSYSH